MSAKRPALTKTKRALKTAGKGLVSLTGEILAQGSPTLGVAREGFRHLRSNYQKEQEKEYRDRTRETVLDQQESMGRILEKMEKNIDKTSSSMEDQTKVFTAGLENLRTSIFISQGKTNRILAQSQRELVSALKSMSKVSASIPAPSAFVPPQNITPPQNAPIASASARTNKSGAGLFGGLFSKFMGNNEDEQTSDGLAQMNGDSSIAKNIAGMRTYQRTLGNNLENIKKELKGMKAKQFRDYKTPYHKFMMSKTEEISSSLKKIAGVMTKRQPRGVTQQKGLFDTAFDMIKNTLTSLPSMLGSALGPLLGSLGMGGAAAGAAGALAKGKGKGKSNPNLAKTSNKDKPKKKQKTPPKRSTKVKSPATPKGMSPIGKAGVGAAGAAAVGLTALSTYESIEELEEAVKRGEISQEDADRAKYSIMGSGILGTAGTILGGIGGGALGTLFGGPVGTAMGGVAGSMAGGAAGSSMGGWMGDKLANFMLGEKKETTPAHVQTDVNETKNVETENEKKDLSKVLSNDVTRPIIEVLNNISTGIQKIPDVFVEMQNQMALNLARNDANNRSTASGGKAVEVDTTGLRGSEKANADFYNNLLKTDNVAAEVAWKESRGGMNLTNSAGSATGLFQIIDKTWEDAVAQMKDKGLIGAEEDYGLGERRDPEKNYNVWKYVMEDDMKALSKSLGKNVGWDQARMLNVLGRGDYETVAKSDGNMIAADLVPSAARNNHNLFHDSQGTPFTVDQFRKRMTLNNTETPLEIANKSARETQQTAQTTPPVMMMGGGGGAPAPAPAPSNTTIVNNSGLAAADVYRLGYLQYQTLG